MQSKAKAFYWCSLESLLHHYYKIAPQTAIFALRVRITRSHASSKMSVLRYAVRKMRVLFHPLSRCNHFACSMAEGEDPSSTSGSSSGADSEDAFAQLLSLPEEISTKRHVCVRCKWASFLATYYWFLWCIIYRRPSRVCICSCFPDTPLPVQSRIIILQHPHEASLDHFRNYSISPNHSIGVSFSGHCATLEAVPPSWQSFCDPRKEIWPRKVCRFTVK